MARKKLGNETRPTQGAGSPSGGFSVFTVGNTRESLLNVHKAVAAFAPKPKPPTRGAKRLSIADNSVTVTPAEFVQFWERLREAAKKHPGLVVNIADPMNAALSAQFAFGAQDETVQKVTATELFKSGLNPLLGNGRKVMIGDMGLLSGTAGTPLSLPQAQPTHHLGMTRENTVALSEIGDMAALRRILQTVVGQLGSATVCADGKPRFILKPPRNIMDIHRKIVVTADVPWLSVLARMEQAVPPGSAQSARIIDATGPDNNRRIEIGVIASLPRPKKPKSPAPGG